MPFTTLTISQQYPDDDDAFFHKHVSSKVIYFNSLLLIISYTLLSFNDGFKYNKSCPTWNFWDSSI